MRSLNDILKKEINMSSEKLEITMQEALIDVNFNEATKAPAAPITSKRTRATINLVLVSALGSIIL